ncbi:MAG: putative quinol monooxygenase [Pseudomonadota bacterium]
MATLTVMARISPKPEHLDDARKAIEEILEPTRSEPGCHRFDLFTGNSDGCLYLFEEWDNDEALEQHYAQPYTAKVFALYQDWLAHPVEVHRMTKAT